MACRVVDSISGVEKFVNFLLLEEGNGEFAIARQWQGTKAEVEENHLTEDVALVLWRKLLTAAFYAVTKNAGDSDKLAERRLATLH